jgi:predicted transcriptional regulator
MCREDTRKAFNEFKRVIDIELFPFSESVKEEMQNQLVQGLCSRVVKHFVVNYNLSVTQIKRMQDVIEQYEQIVLTTSNNYSRRYL